MTRHEKQSRKFEKCDKSQCWILIGVISESEEESPPKAPVAEVAPLTVLPDDLDEITTGTWGLPQLDKDEAPRKCFNNSLEFNAWSCDIPFRYYSIDITEIKNASKLANYDLELFAINETDAQFIWGTQPPSVPRPIPLQRGDCRRYRHYP